MSTTTAAPGMPHSAGQAPPEAPRRVAGGLLDPAMLVKALPDAVRKLDPRVMWRNPVMLIVEIGAVLTTVLAVRHPSVFGWSITVWLWLTVVFANLAEAVAEGRGKAQAESLRKTRTQTVARALRATTFSEFSTLVEGIHNGVHGWVGGAMSAVPIAAYDPVFWAHHGMIDRLWYLWQISPRGTNPPADLLDQALGHS